MAEAGRIETSPGCPSGLQTVPPAVHDPYGAELDLSGYVTRSGSQAHIDLVVQGAHCAGCVRKIETGLSEIAGVKTARMNLSTSRLSVDWEAARADVSGITQRLSDLGFGAAPYTVSRQEKTAQAENSFLLRCMAVAGFALMNVMLLSISVWSGGGEMTDATKILFHRVSALIAVPTVIYAGRPFFRSALKALRKRQTNMDVPISLAIILATSLSIWETVRGEGDTYFDAAVMLVFLLLIGRYLDSRMRARTGEAARKLAALQVTSATRLRDDGRTETVPARDIGVGETVLIPIGQRSAVDGEVIDGVSELDVRIVTGESRPRSVGPGDRIWSGTVNLTAPLTIRSTALHQDSFLSEITGLVEAGEQSKSGYVRIADRAAQAYVPVVHSVALLTFIGWLLVGAELRHAAICAIAVLIITCPCALGLAVPAVNIVAVGELFKKGVLIRSGDVLERLGRVNRALFDKTGTLTGGRPELIQEDHDAEDVLRLAGALARYSSHPLSRALQVYDMGDPVEAVTETAGQGVSGIIDGKKVKLGSDSFVGAQAGTVQTIATWLCIEDQDPIRLDMSDQVRPEAKDTVARLAAMNIPAEMLTGDTPDIAKDIAEAIGIKSVHAALSPADKLVIIKDRLDNGDYPLMIGDGINDAPALAQAHASVSLSSASDISRDSADVILQRDSLSALPEVISVARRSQARIRENLTLAVIYNMFAVPLAVFGFVTPLIAAVAMSGSSLLVTLNALRMKS